MAKIYPNMGKEFCENPPYIANCKYCGAEAEFGGTTWWEWWQYTCCCSKRCYESTQIYGGCKSPQEVINEWNEINKGANQ